MKLLNKIKNKGKMKNEKTKKGQYFSFDAITAVIIFIITISLVVSYWFTIQGVINTNDSDAYRVAIRISDTLVSKGNPAFSTLSGEDDWVDLIWSGNIDDIQTPGLGQNSSLPILDQRYLFYGTEPKLNRIGTATGDGGDFLDEDAYNNLKQALRTSYDFNIKIYTDGGFNGGEGTPFFNIGLDDYEDKNKTVTTYNRIIVMNDTSGNLIRGNLQVNVWVD